MARKPTGYNIVDYPAPVMEYDMDNPHIRNSCPECPECPRVARSMPSPNNNNIVLSPLGGGTRSLTLGGTMLSPTYILMVIGFLAFLTGVMISKKK